MTQLQQGHSALPEVQAHQGQDILDMVEHELIPRLLMLDSAAGESAHPSPCPSPSPQPAHDLRDPDNPIAQQLATLTLEGNLAACEAFVERLRQEGLRLESVFLDVIQPAARILGTRWKEDLCSFVDVTTGLWQLQQIFHRLMHDFQSEPSPHKPLPTGHGNRPSAFFCTIPGAHHRLGVQMVSAFFCRAGWQTGLAHQTSAEDIIDEACLFAPDLLGISLSSERDMTEAPAFILALRKATFKTRPIIMIGGPGPGLFPELAQHCQADLISGDAPSAIEAAYSKLQSRHGRAAGA